MRVRERFVLIFVLILFITGKRIFLYVFLLIKGKHRAVAPISRMRRALVTWYACLLAVRARPVNAERL